MYELINSEKRWVRNTLSALALLLLAGCLAYNVYVVLVTPNPGFTFDARWEITDVHDCDEGPDTCPDVTAIRNHDQLLSVGGLTLQEYENDPNMVPFAGFPPGDMVPLSIERDGQTFEVEWRMQPVRMSTVIRFSVISLLVYGSFWIAGTFVLRFMRPADLTWVLLVALFYLFTIWLAVGLVSLSNVARSAEILRVVGWLMAPVLVHLHLVAPASRLRRSLRLPVAAMYGLALLLLALQLAGLLPWLAYLGGIMLAALVSIGLLTYRVATPRALAEKMTARLMLAGIVLAFVPGLLLSALPLLLNVSGSDAVSAAISVLTLPMLPLFYTYAIYKHRLGSRERRINRLLVQYALFLIYFSLLILVFVIVSNWAWTANAAISVIILVALALIIALLPIRRPVQTVFDRFTYGTRYSHREILADYAQRILATVDKQNLVHLLKYELAPEMEIRQSALYSLLEDQVVTLYTQGVGAGSGPTSLSETRAILANADENEAGADQGGHSSAERLAWVQLVVPLLVKGQPSGVWLFGRRESDDIYSQDDVSLLTRLAAMVAVTLESSELLEALTDELDTRKAAEARLEEQSERLRILHEIDRAILAADAPAEIACAAFSGLRQLVPHARASVLLLDPEGDSMTVLAAQGSGVSIVAENDVIPRQAMPAFELLSTGQAFIDQDVSAADGEDSLARTLAPAGVRAVISVPLMSSGSAFGALNVAHDIPGSYTQVHVGIVKDVANAVALAIHNARLREEVSKNSEALQRLSARLIDAQEIERKRLSHELHDEMGQILTAISLSLAAIERKLPVDGGDSLRDQVSDANELVLALMDQVRSLSLELRPSMLHDLGLISTLRWYVANHAKRSQAEITLEANDLPDRLPEKIEIAAYRVVQEALTNASRHSAATQVSLRVHGVDGCIQVVVEDNGRGFDPEKNGNNGSTTSGIGLVTMRERVSALDGRLEVRAAPGKGTCIMAELPFEGAR